MQYNSCNLKAIKSLHIFPDPDSPPISGYVLIKDSKIEAVISSNSPEAHSLKQRNYQIIDYEQSYIFPGLIDLNVHLNSVCDNEWEDVENIGKMALQGGITTIIDNPIMGLYSEQLDESKAIARRIQSLEGRIFTDTGLLAYIGPHNLEEIEGIWTRNRIIGFRLYLAKSLMHQLPHFDTKDYPQLQQKLTQVQHLELKMFIHCESATARDMFTSSPLRYLEKETRLDLKFDIKDSSKFGGGIQGEMGDLEADSNKSSSSDSDSENEEQKDGVKDLMPSQLATSKPNNDEVQSGVLRKKADKNAKLQEEQSIARLEIVGYSFKEDEKEIIKNLNISDSELEYIGHSDDSSDAEPQKEMGSHEDLSKKEIKVENLKKNIIATKILKAQGVKRNSFLNNPLIGSLRDALGQLNNTVEEEKEKEKENEEESNMNKNMLTRSQPPVLVGDSTSLIKKAEDYMCSSQPGCDTVSLRTRIRSPSGLLQRRKMTNSPTQTSPETNPNQIEFKIKCKKAAEEQESYDKELKINRDYQLFLSNHSLSWETNGVSSILTFLGDLYHENNKNCKGTLILSNLSSSNSAFLVRGKAKALDYHLKIFCETSLPFIYFHMNHVKLGQSKFKCSPCIRDKETRNLLIDGLMLKNLFHAVSSFHLQVDKKFKRIEKGNFKRCFNGVSTIGSNLQVVWTKIYVREKKKIEKEGDHNEKKYEAIFKRLVQLLASSPAELAGLGSKGKIKAGFDADLVIWNPFKMVEMNKKNIYLKYPALYLFRNQKFYGEVQETYLRGKCVFAKDSFVSRGVILAHK